ncbi:hypothetical protein KKF55_01465 [Patescibacteria group bacterium]|nr:hypothetical protein [Patescibacteria group bacterium]
MNTFYNSLEPPKQIRPPDDYPTIDDQRIIAIITMVENERISVEAACRVTGLPLPIFLERYKEETIDTENPPCDNAIAKIAKLIAQETGVAKPKNHEPDNTTNQDSDAPELDGPVSDEDNKGDGDEEDKDFEPPIKNVFAAIAIGDEENFEPEPKTGERTDSMPGTKTRLDVMAKRVEKGLSPWNKDDRKEMDSRRF